MKILLGGLHQEINSFAPGKTTPEHFKRKQYWLGEDMLRYADEYVCCDDDADVLSGSYTVLKEAGVEIVPGGFLGAQPGPAIEQSVIDDYIAQLKETVKRNLPLDGVVLVMHGAAQGEKTDDPEGDIIVAVRELVGKDVPITVALDMHANVTKRMVENANTLSLYQKYPHTDIWETGARAARLCLRILKGEIKPCMAYVQIPMIAPASAYTTEIAPFKGLMQKGHDYVKSGKLIDFSVAQMQPWLDAKDGYSSVVTVGENKEEIARIAKELATDLYAMRHEFRTELYGVDDIIGRAEKNESGKPVILNDFADSSNAGAAGDSPETIARVLALSSDVRGLMYINDGEFAAACREVGVGNKICAPLGAKFSTKLFAPVPVEATVKALFDGVMPFRGMMADFGPSAVVQIRNMFVIVTTQHRYNGDPCLYRAFGYEPTDFQMVVFKANTSFRAFYAPLTDLIYPAATKGSSTADLRSLPFKNVPKSFYPFSDNEFLPQVDVFEM